MTHPNHRSNAFGAVPFCCVPFVLVVLAQFRALFRIPFVIEPLAPHRVRFVELGRRYIEFYRLAGKIF